MYVVTFYSDQGGTGRTTALVNVAADLALRGRKVLLVDFDLHKPALSGFGPLALSRQRPGVVEFVTDYLQQSRSPAVEDGYLYEAKIEAEDDCSVWVMPAGRLNDAYWGALTRLDWQDLYAVREGFLFMEDLKAQWRDILKVDYVLIDAPAGRTNLTGICTRQLADDVVFLMVPDGSDLGGTERVMRDVFRESLAETPRRINMHFASSKVPDHDGAELPGARQLDAILEPDWTISDASSVGIMFELSVEFPHDPALLGERQVIVSRRPQSRLACQYRRLSNAIILENFLHDREGAQAFLKKLQLQPDLVVGDEGGDPADRWFDDTQKLEQLIEQFTAKRDEHNQLVDPSAAKHDAEVLGQAASCLYLAHSREQAAEVLGQALEQSPHDPALLWQQASYRFRQRNPRFVDDLMDLLDSQSEQAQPSRSFEDLLQGLKGRVRESLSQLPRLDTQPLRHDVLPLETVAGVNNYVVSAVRLIRREAPERLEEALQRARVRSLSQADRDRLLAAETPRSNYPDQEPEWLIRWGHFREVINRLEPIVQGASEANFQHSFHLAMAYWAVGEEAKATKISQEALKPGLILELEDLSAVSESTEEYLILLQLFTLLAFRAGDLTLAEQLAVRLVGDLVEQFKGVRFFSHWRYRTVRFNLFREDCRNLQRMIRQRRGNLPISPPPFLPKPTSGA